jgi:hypothetical protein
MPAESGGIYSYMPPAGLCGSDKIGFSTCRWILQHCQRKYCDWSNIYAAPSAPISPIWDERDNVEAVMY